MGFRSTPTIWKRSKKPINCVHLSSSFFFILKNWKISSMAFFYSKFFFFFFSKKKTQFKKEKHFIVRRWKFLDLRLLRVSKKKKNLLKSKEILASWIGSTIDSKVFLEHYWIVTILYEHSRVLFGSKMVKFDKNKKQMDSEPFDWIPMIEKRMFLPSYHLFMFLEWGLCSVCKQHTNT